jgi:hypothetical protein
MDESGLPERSRDEPAHFKYQMLAIITAMSSGKELRGGLAP